MLATSQAACWIFWTYLLVLLARWQVSAPVACGGVIALAVHPAAFFLVAGYSESLFLTAMIGFVFYRAGGMSRRELRLALGRSARVRHDGNPIVGVCVAFFPWPGRSSRSR